MCCLKFRLRGLLGVCNTLTCNAAWLLALIAFALLPFDACLIVSMFPCIMFLCACYFMTESPLWFVKMGRIDEAEKALTYLRGSKYSISVELEELMHCAAEQTDKPISMKKQIQYLTSKSVRKPVVLLSLMFVFQVRNKTWTP